MIARTGVGERGSRRRARAGALAGVLLLVAAVLAACGEGGDKPAEGGGTLTIAVDRGVGSLNPAVDAGASGAGFMLYLPYATLVERSAEDGSFSPGLAESYGYVGEGNTTYELKLRPDLQFADGTPLDAEAVKTWLTYFPTAGGGYSSQLAIGSIETPDDLTVRLHLARPTPLVTAQLANAWGMVMSPKALSDPAQLAAGAPGAGPYVYDQANTVTGMGATYTFVPNEHYHEPDQVKWSKIVVKVIEDPGARLRAMQSGDVDIAMGSVATVEAAKKAGLKVSTAAAGMVSINMIDAGGAKAPALGDVRVRQALSMAIDREAIATSLFHGAVEPISAIVTADGTDPEFADPYPYDPERARELLAEAGYPDGFSFELVATTFGTLTGTPLTQAISQDWADIGVDVKIIATATQAEFVEKFLTGSAFIADYPVFPALQLAEAWYSEDSATNVYDFEYRDLDDLRRRAATASPEQVPALSKEVVRRVAEQAYALPIATKPAILYSNDRVSGVEAEEWINASPVARTWSPS